MSTPRITRFGFAPLLLALAVFAGCQKPVAPVPGSTAVAKTSVADEIPTTPPKLPDSETEPAPDSTPDSASATTPTPALAARDTDDAPTDETPADDNGDKKPKPKNGKTDGQTLPAQKPVPPKNPEPPKNDEINLNNPSTPTGLTAITVNGGDPTGGSDVVIVNGTTGLDTIGYAPTAADAATLTGVQGVAQVNVATTESVRTW